VAVSQAQEAAEQANDSTWLDFAVRGGLVAYGIVHVLVAGLALALAFGKAPEPASQQGAMQALAEQPWGPLMLGALAIGFAALAIWQLVEAVIGHRNAGDRMRWFWRALAAGRVAVYAAFGYSAISTAFGGGSSTSKNRLTAEVMRLPLGPLLIALAGLVFVAVGVGLAWQGVTRSFLDNLRYDANTGSSGTALVAVGVFGYPMKGLALGVIGALLIWAAVTYDPRHAGGLDVALRTLIAQPVGPWLLAFVAVGIGCFGLYCFGWARYADTSA
jgi:hypothetical protein